MSPTFSGFFILDVLILTFILLIPIPTTPFLIYLVINLSILEFMFIYLIASNLYISILYLSGIYMDKIRFGHYLSKINISSESNKFLKMKAWRDKAYDFALSKLKEISIWNIIVIRTIGVHATIVAFGSGMVKGKYSNNIIANSILAILDVAFYWVLLGSGKIIFAKFFPGIDVEYYLKEYFFQTITFSLIIFYVLFFAVKLIKYRNGNKF